MLRTFTSAGSPALPPDNADTLHSRIEALLAAGDSASRLRAIAQQLHAYFKASGTAIALEQPSGILCVASAGETAPDVGTPLNVSTGLSGICFRSGESQRCFDARTDLRVDAASCKALGIVSILIVPVKDGDRTVGLVEVFSQEEFYFNNNDTADLEQIAPLVLEAARNEPRSTAPAPGASRSAYIAPAETPAPQLGPQLVIPSPVDAPPPVASAPATAAVEAPPEAADLLLAAPEVAAAHEAVSPTPSAPRSRYILAAAGLIVLLAAGWGASRWLLPASGPSGSTSQAPPASVAPAAAATPISNPAPAANGRAPQSAPLQSQPSASATRTAAAKPVKGAAGTASASPNIQNVSTLSVQTQAVPAKAVSASDTSAPSPGLQSKPSPIVASSPASSQPPASAADAAPAPPPVNTANLAAPGERFPVTLDAGTAAAANRPVTPAPPSSTIEPERLIRRVNPVYPAIARASKVTGEVIVDITITKEGNVTNPVVETGPAVLRPAVLDAVKQWKYKPYLLNGVPQEIHTKVKVNFRQ